MCAYVSFFRITSIYLYFYDLQLYYIYLNEIMCYFSELGIELSCLLLP